MNDQAARAQAARAAAENLKQRRARFMERLEAARADARGETFLWPADLVRDMQTTDALWVSMLPVDQADRLADEGADGLADAKLVCPLCGSPVQHDRSHRT